MSKTLQMIYGLCLAVAASNGVYGAETNTTAIADTTRLLDDVTVTAIKQKRDLSLQPLSATVVSGEQVRMWNVNSVKQMSEISPNFFMPDYGSRITSSVYVRGIGARMEQPVVGLNVDNLPYLNKDNYDFDISDIERVEVLRGPQSTLYGRNTMGGQINIYTLAPMSYQGTRAIVQAGNGAVARVALSHYAKFTPRLAMSLAGDFRYNHGFYDNHYNGKPVESEKSGGLRWRTQWRPSGHMSVDNVLSLSILRQSGYAYENMGSGIVNYNDTCFYRRNAVSDGLTVKWTGDGVSVSSITGFQYLDDNMTLDQDFLPVDYFTLTQKRREWSLSQEVVVRGSVEKYSWIAGAFAFYRHTRMSAPVSIKESGIKRMITDNVNNNDRIPVRLDWCDPELNLGDEFTIPIWNIALYHQSDLRLGRWLFSAGMRLDFEKTFLDYRSFCNTAFEVSMKRPIPGMPPIGGRYEIPIDDTGRLRQHFWEFMPKVTVSYDLPMDSKSSVYASVGEGYKSGGFNTQMFSTILQQKLESSMRSFMPGMGGALSTDIDVDNIVSYKPEHSWNYEIGAHIGCAQGRVMTDVSLFYIDCRDQQITTFPDASTTGRITTNAGRTRSFGAEVQIKYTPNEHWAVNAAYGYTNATFRRYEDRGVDYRGKYVPYAPSNTLFVSGAYNHNVGADKRWNLCYNLNMRGIGRIYWDESNSLSQHFYAQFGASVAARTERVSVEAWIENLTGTKFNTFYFESIGNRFVQRGKPRRFGVTVRLNFDFARR